MLSKEASGTIFITSLVLRGQGLNPRPPAHGANTLTTEPPLHLWTGVLQWWGIMRKVKGSPAIHAGQHKLFFNDVCMFLLK